MQLNNLQPEKSDKKSKVNMREEKNNSNKTDAANKDNFSTGMIVNNVDNPSIKDRNNKENKEQKEIRNKIIKKKKKKNNLNIIIISTLFITTFLSLLLCILLLFSYNREKENVIAVMNELEQVKEEKELLYSEDDLQNILGEKIKEKEDEKQKELAEQKRLLESKMQTDLANQISNEKNILLEEVRGLVDEGEGIMTILQTLYPDEVVVASDGKYHLLPINHNLKKNNFDLTKFTYPIENEENGKYEGTANYTLEDGTKAKKGIDVSTFQGEIDWEKVKNTDIDFAIIRLGFRGYESGKIVLDNHYETNIEGSIKAGLDTGVYFFTEAIDEKEAMEEADFVIENLQGHKINMPIVLDVEESANPEKTRTKNVTKEQRTKNVIAFCERIKEAGYDVMIYGNLKSFMIMMDYEKLENYDKWFAYYRYPFHFPYKIKMWQYTSTEKINGIKGDVDVNIMFY